MNGNRSRYSTNPTFNMQKRSMFKKNTSPAPEKPDFTAAPDPVSSSQQPFNQNIPAQTQPIQGPAYPPAADLFSAPMTSQNLMGMQPASLLHSSTSFHPGVFQSRQTPLQNQMTGSFSMQPPTQPGYPFGQPAQNLPPLGNQNPTGQNAPFSPHSQGFTPPPVNQPAQQPFFNGINTQPANAPTVQQANPFEPSPLQQPAMGYNRSAMPVQQGMHPNPSGFGMQKAPAQSVDPDTLWKVFLFVLLPVLFIPCLFVPDNLKVLCYVFIALCAAGIGVIWYRRMFNDNTRILVTLLYAAACVVLIVMLFGGSSHDSRQPDTTDPAQQQATQTFGTTAQGEESIAQPTFSPTPEPTPTVVPISEAQTRLEAFMTNWSGARIEDMVRLVQPSWANGQDNPSNRLFVMLGNRTPLTYTIEEISGSDTDSSRTVTMTANIDKNNGKDPTLYRFMVLMVKEGGEWYVDPNSLASNDEVENSEETNVVNDSQNTTAENWTIAPRQTVTPAPPADQPLYYNPDGGSMYHMDQYCSSIREEYLPLQGSFPYYDLGSHRDLTPCLKCSAPTQTLPPEDTGSGI